MTIGTFATRAGVTPHTVRYYERIGLLPTPMRAANGYRVYPEALLNRIALVRHAQQFGFPLRDLIQFLAVRERGGKPCHDVRAAAQRMLEQVDRDIDRLRTKRAHMRRTLAVWDRQLAATPPHAPARLLETLLHSDQ
ncbi:MAG TPA: heavy metal-responsive transcriptional regulator [Vicinamibacterales bacterium]|nr:heavy metal-responsive transcriptional regulator [Vicinamibacterales bacterium]